MHFSYAHFQMKYKSSLELGLQTFVILNIHPHKNPTIDLEFFLSLVVLAALMPNNLFASLNDSSCKSILPLSIASDTILSKHWYNPILMLTLTLKLGL